MNLNKKKVDETGKNQPLKKFAQRNKQQTNFDKFTNIVNENIIKKGNDCFNVKNKLSDEIEDIENFIKELNLIHAGQFYRYENGYYQEVEKRKIKKTVIKNRNNNKYKKYEIDCIIEGIKSLSDINTNELNNKKYINLRNGLFNLETYKLEKHKEDIYSTIRIPIKYEKNAEINEFQEFLNLSIPDEMEQKQLQQFIGYCLSNDTRHHLALFLIGEGGNGKGVLTKIIDKLIGKSNISFLGITDLGSEKKRISLIGKSVNISTEIAGKINRNDFKTFKQLTSFETITGKYLYKDIISFTPQAKFIFSTNEQPIFPENNEATFRRLLFINFPHTFGDTKAGADFPKNPHLFNHLLKELPGIFNWAIEGLKELRENGEFIQNDESREKRLILERKNNSVKMFIKERCSIQLNAKDTADTFYTAYKRYCDDYGIKNKNSKNTIGKYLSKLTEVVRSRKTINKQKQTVYTGIEVEKGK